MKSDQTGVKFMERLPKKNEIYRHFKGNLYKIITLARDAGDGRRMVVYQALYGEQEVYVRSLDEFMSLVDKEKYPEISQERRFEPQPASAESETARLPENMEEGEEHVEALDPLLLAFLDADSYERKLEILSALQARITDDMINTMAASLDVEIEEEELEKRYFSLRNCLLTLDRFECSRLR